jgi:tRNA (guanine-N7-)-methyltransferase
MRLRNVKGSRERIQTEERAMDTPKEYKGKWNEVFNNDNPIYIEIGMGKGTFLTQHANNNPNINYIGIEKFSSVIIRAIEKLPNVVNNNLFLIRMDAEAIEEVFENGEIDRIYLNFSDPWPKERHAKRRLTSKEFLARYNKILTSNGRVEFKTDNRKLFDFSLEQIAEANWKVETVTFDLHSSKYVEGNIMTEYETKFVSLGNPINRVVTYR